MKKYLISAAMLLSGMAAVAQTGNDPIVMTVAGVDVPRSEFEYSYNKNNTDGEIKKKTVGYMGKKFILDVVSQLK